jgi:hypothetical protein
MKELKQLKLLLIISHSLIPIAAGHGLGILFLFEIISPIRIFQNGILFDINADFQDRLMLVGLISILSKIILIISLVIKNSKFKNWLTISGIFVLWFATYTLTKKPDIDSLADLPLITSLIAIILSVVVLIKTLNKELKLKKKGIVKHCT